MGRKRLFAALVVKESNASFESILLKKRQQLSQPRAQQGGIKTLHQGFSSVKCLRRRHLTHAG